MHLLSNEWSCLSKQQNTQESYCDPDIITLCYTAAGGIAYNNAYFGVGSGPIHLDNVACTGTEEALVNCNYDPNTADCSHYEDAGVRCSQTCEFAAFFF